MHFATAPSPPTRSPAPTQLAPASRLGVFNGLNQPGLSAADNGADQGIPPDTTGSIGPSHYVEMVNSVIGVYRRSDLTLVSKASITSWLNAGALDFPCDPQIQWDSSSQRWLYVVLGCGLNVDKFLFGWSKTSDPSDLVNGWCRFTKSTLGEFTDYPKLGHNSNYMLIGTNTFSDAGSFRSAQIFWMHKPAIGDTSCAAPAVQSKGSGAMRLKNGDGTLTWTPVPVNTMTNAANGYIVSAYDPSGPTIESKLAVWHLTSGGVLLADSDLTVSPYTVPANAPNLGGSTFLIDTLDGRLTQAVGDPATGIYTQHTVNGAGGRSKVRWYEIRVVSSVLTLIQQGDISSLTDFVFNGAISPRLDAGGAVIFYNRSSAAIYPVIAAQGRLTLTPSGQMNPGEIILATSSAGDNDFSCNYQGSLSSCRWGDYAGASPDPINANVVWGSNQILTSPSTLAPNWATQNYAIAGPLLRSPATQGSPAPTPGRDPASQSSPSPTPGTR